MSKEVIYEKGKGIEDGFAKFKGDQIVTTSNRPEGDSLVPYINTKTNSVPLEEGCTIIYDDDGRPERVVHPEDDQSEGPVDEALDGPGPGADNPPTEKSDDNPNDDPEEDTPPEDEPTEDTPPEEE